MADHRHGHIKRYALWVLMTFIILVPALYNGFPLMFSDTGTYIRSGFELLVPPDRPIIYGLFTQWTSGFGITLWGPVVVQAVLAALVIWRIWHAFFTEVKAKWFLPFLLILSCASGLGWHAGRLLPDVFIPLALLSIMDLIYGSPSRPWRLFHMFLILFTGAVHFSSLYIFGFALLIPLFAVLKKALPWYGLVTVVMAMVLSVLLTLVVNRQYTGEAFISRSGSLFLTGRLLDAGLLKEWLHSYCAEHEFYLCKHANDLPKNSQALLWGGPVDDAGGWEAVRDQSSAMVAAYFREWGNAMDFVRVGIRSALQQLTLWGLEYEMVSQWYRTDGAPPNELVRSYFPDQMPAFLAAKQNGGSGELNMCWANVLHHLLLAIGTIVLLVVAIKPMLLNLSNAHRWIAVYTLLAVVFAAGFCAAVSMPDQRFLARVSWVIPLMGFGLGLRMLAQGKA